MPLLALNAGWGKGKCAGRVVLRGRLLFRPRLLCRSRAVSSHSRDDPARAGVRAPVVDGTADQPEQPELCSGAQRAERAEKPALPSPVGGEPDPELFGRLG
jgi:hypothetical protein